MTLRPEIVVIDLAVTLALCGVGVLGAWLMRRRTERQPRTVPTPAAAAARRVREFRISSDTFGALARGEVVIYTPIAGEPRRAQILPVGLDQREPSGIDPSGPRTACEVDVHPGMGLTVGGSSDRSPLTERTGSASTL